LRRFFDIEAGTAEIAWLMDKTSAIAGIVQRIAVSSSEAEIALLVRSDLKRRGIGEFLLRQILARAFRQGFRTASATIYRDNRAMQRLAAKVGYVIRKSSAFAIDLTFDAAAAGTARLPPAMDGQPAFRRSAG
jgi:RimJ/RimL family protein N-acetyltransferase